MEESIRCFHRLRIFPTQPAAFRDHEGPWWRQPIIAIAAAAEGYNDGGYPFMQKSKDQDRNKGALEQDSQNERGNTNMQGQLGHRDQDADLKDADSDQPG